MRRNLSLVLIVQIIFFVSLGLYLFGVWPDVTRVLAAISSIVMAVVLLINE